MSADCALPTIGSLFAGIGGFDLGFERAGFQTVWQVEIDPWARRVLEKNFPHAERFSDIRDCGRHNLQPVDVLCGGFPCQDISNAGLRAGIEGERSGLWGEFARIIGELRPKFVLVENVAALLGRGMGRVLGDLSALGYDAEWEVVSAADVGAPHLRERVWILAYPASIYGGQGWSRGFVGGAENREGERPEALAHAPGERCGEEGEYRSDKSAEWIAGRSEDDPHPHIVPLVRSAIARGELCAWNPEPKVGRVVDGLPVAMVADELRGLGNAVVPQIPELYARRIRPHLLQPVGAHHVR